MSAPVEITDLRGPNEKHFVHPHDADLVIAQVSPHVLHVPDGCGGWVERNYAAADSGRGPIVYDSGTYKAVLPRTARGTFEFRSGDDSVQIKFADPTTARACVVDDTKVAYTEAWKNTDLVYESTPQGLKEVLVVKEWDSPREFRFRITAASTPATLEYAPGDATVPYVSRIRVGSIEIPAPIASDSADNHVQVSWQVDGDEVIVRFFPNGATHFPVEIDPSFTSNSGSASSTSTVTTHAAAIAILTAQARFTSQSTSSSTSSSSTNSNTGTLNLAHGVSTVSTSTTQPTVPGGWSFNNWSASGSASADDGTTMNVTLTGANGATASGTSSASLGPVFSDNTGGTVSFSGTGSVGTSSTTLHANVSATTNYSQSTFFFSANPNMQCNGGAWINPTSTSANSPSTTRANNGLSGWGTTNYYALAGMVPGTNTLTHFFQTVAHNWDLLYLWTGSWGRRGLDMPLRGMRGRGIYRFWN